MSRFLRLPDGRVRARRVATEDGFLVESRTIGTEMAFNLEADNLSRTGFLLTSANYHKVPFRENTILELKIDIKGKHFRDPVQCLGKVVRMSEAEDDAAYDDDAPIQKRFGVCIVQMEGRDLELWERGVANLEKVDADKTSQATVQAMLGAAA